MSESKLVPIIHVSKTNKLTVFLLKKSITSYVIISIDYFIYDTDTKNISEASSLMWHLNYFLHEVK